MLRAMVSDINLTPAEKQELIMRSRSRSLRVEDVRRARLILMLDAGDSYAEIQAALKCQPSYITQWKKRFLADRLAGFHSRHPGRAAQKRTPQLEARILYWTAKKPPDGSTHWTTRKLARQLGTNHMMVARVWKRARLQPQ